MVFGIKIQKSPCEKSCIKKNFKMSEKALAPQKAAQRSFPAFVTDETVRKPSWNLDYVKTCYPATKDLAFRQRERFFVTAVLEKSVQHLRSSE
jgi:hypothetical protein